MDNLQTVQLHATCVALDGCGVMLRGAPGSGKSDLALRLIDEPGCGTGAKLVQAKLIGDDQILLTRRANELIVSPVTALAGLLEIRGIGIVELDYLAQAPLALVVDIEQQAGIERLPEPEESLFEILGVRVLRIAIDASLPSAAAKVRAGLQALEKNLAAGLN